VDSGMKSANNWHKLSPQSGSQIHSTKP
jgi:hypothetical protein